jgi:hypothetical protein
MYVLHVSPFFGDWSDWSSKISPCFDGGKNDDVSTEGHTGFSIGPGGFVGRKPTDSKAEKRVGMVGNIVVLSNIRCKSYRI